ncbi:hypothetical protein EKO27_g3286 [Xylaria grammica]|uniref:Major facilitator superfamily (MFS) profile domain-containing protein n=1 Tax=Xylaria grammica TaxID=363999 RepID=A0A439DBQ0_9PEZI|nr:hypothetical protein EKO27_g3286 [Xylaria grammica]
MSLTLSISKSGLTVSRHPTTDVKEHATTNGLGTEKPDIASLDSFGSKIRALRLLENRNRNPRKARPSRQPQNEPVGQQHFSVKPNVEGYDYPGAPRSSSKNEAPPGPIAELTPISNIVELSSIDPCFELTSGTSAPDGGTVRSSTLDAPCASGIDVGDVGEGSSIKGVTYDRQTKSNSIEQSPLDHTSNPISGSPGVPLRGKDSIRSTSWKPDQVHIPRTRWERLRNITVAGPTTLKIEDVEFSPASREKLRNFAQILASTKGQIELFGKELPLCRASLVQVKEGEAMPATYICIQGLKNAADITRIHSAMSHGRYKRLYSPLKLCYETSDLVHVTSSRSEWPGYLQSSASTRSTNPSVYSFTPKPPKISTIGSMGEPQSYVPTSYQYLPTPDGGTYCGALARTYVNGRHFVSTLGGSVRVNGRTYLMTCHHGFQRPPTEASCSLSDTTVGDDASLPAEAPLVFCSGDLLDDTEDMDHHEASTPKGRLANLVSSPPKWADLSIVGQIRTGQEWVLIPMEDISILPNLMKKPRPEAVEDIEEPEIYYLDDIAKPRPGNLSYIMTSSRKGCTGFLSANTSFILGGGMSNMLEIWTMNLDEGQGLQKGDSGSWVLDTSDSSQYRVLGSVIATSHGAAHFVPLLDLFNDILNDFGGDSSMTLAPVFQTLARRAHLAFGRNDPSSEALIDEAFSPQVLRQLCTGWYLPAIKGIVGVHDSRTTELPAFDPWNELNIKTLKTLFLRYGVALLDNIHDEPWIRKCGNELDEPKSRVLKEFVTIARPLFKTRFGDGATTTAIDEARRDVTSLEALEPKRKTFGSRVSIKPTRVSSITYSKISAIRTPTKPVLRSQLRSEVPNPHPTAAHSPDYPTPTSEVERAMRREKEMVDPDSPYAPPHEEKGEQDAICHLTPQDPSDSGWSFFPFKSVDIGKQYVWVEIAPHLVILVIQSFIGLLVAVSGRRLFTFIIAVLFVVGSGIAGGATNAAMLISGRALQGLGLRGARVLIHMALFSLVPAHKFTSYLGIVSSMNFIGVPIGPIIGGAIAKVNWRWCFYLEQITGGLALLSILLFWNVEDARLRFFPWRRADFIGAIIFQGSTTSILLGLVFGGVVFPWESANVIAPLSIGVVGWFAFHVYELICRYPMIPGYLFTNRTSAAGSLMSFTSGLLFNWIIWMLPIYFQAVLGSSPLISGLNQLALNLFLVLASFVAGATLTKVKKYLIIGPKTKTNRPQQFIGFILAGLGIGLLALLGPHTSTAAWIFFQIFAGAGLGILPITILPAIQAAFTADNRAKATDVYTLSYTFGAVWGVAIPSIIFNGQVNNFLHRVSDSQVQKELANGNAYGFASTSGLHQLPSNIKTEVVGVYTDSLKTVWQVAVGFAVVGLLAACFVGDEPRSNEAELGLEANDTQKVPTVE